MVRLDHETGIEYKETVSDDKPMAGLLDRIGVYVLPGRVTRPDRAIGEAQTAEHLGMSRVWLGERLGTKDFGPLLGAVGLATHRIGIGTAITNIGLRHPITLASAAMSLQALTSGRLTLGLGRLNPQAARAYGLTAPDNRAVADTADIVRRLCRGERVSYQGPAGNFPKLRLNDIADVPPPQLILAAIGPKSLALAGRHYDGVLLHPFLTPDAVRRSATRVREAACTEGRDPAEVRVYATVMVAPDLTPSEEVAVLAARAVTYLQVPGYGESIVNANGWDTAPLERLRADPVLAGIPGDRKSVV